MKRIIFIFTILAAPMAQAQNMVIDLRGGAAFPTLGMYQKGYRPAGGFDFDYMYSLFPQKWPVNFEAGLGINYYGGGHEKDDIELSDPAGHDAKYKLQNSTLTGDVRFRLMVGSPTFKVFGEYRSSLFRHVMANENIRLKNAPSGYEEYTQIEISNHATKGHEFRTGVMFYPASWVRFEASVGYTRGTGAAFANLNSYENKPDGIDYNIIYHDRSDLLTFNIGIGILFRPSSTGTCTGISSGNSTFSETNSRGRSCTSSGSSSRSLSPKRSTGR